MAKLKIEMYVNVDWFYVSHRSSIGCAANLCGFDFTAYAAFSDKIDEKVRQNLYLKKSVLSRRKGGLLNIFFSLLYLSVKTFLDKPNILHAVTIKPILVLGIVASLYNINFIGSISGLGPVFNDNTMYAKFRRYFVILLYRQIFRRANSFAICQSESDSKALQKFKIIDRDRIVKIASSGVDLSRNIPSPKDGNICKVMMASRMLRSKGVEEYVFAAKKLKLKHGDRVEFYLAGPLDPDASDGYTEQELLDLIDPTILSYMGNLEDLHNFINTCDIFVLPSSYPEGIPKVLIEAAASGCAVVTTNQRGCKESIIPNVTGKLTEPRDTQDLIETIDWMLFHPKSSHTNGG